MAPVVSVRGANGIANEFARNYDCFGGEAVIGDHRRVNEWGSTQLILGLLVKANSQFRGESYIVSHPHQLQLPVARGK